MLNIARQPFVPAFVTLMVLAIAAVCTLGPWSPPSTELAGELKLLPASAINDFQWSHPLISRIAAFLLLLFTGHGIGRISTRYGLYAVNNCLAIPLFAIIVSCALPTGEFLTIICATTLLGLALHNFCRACRSDFGFDPLFRASLYLGCIPFVLPATLPLLLLMPVAVVVFRRSTRELLVALAGLGLPWLVVSYVAWGGGYPFMEPIKQLWCSFTGGELLRFFIHTPLISLIMLGAIAVTTLVAVLLFLANAYTSGSKPRYILTFNICMLLLCAGLIFAPSAPPGITALVAIPASIILPVFFVRIHHHIATPIYLGFLVCAIGAIFIL